MRIVVTDKRHVEVREAKLLDDRIVVDVELSRHSEIHVVLEPGKARSINFFYDLPSRPSGEAEAALGRLSRSIAEKSLITSACMYDVMFSADGERFKKIRARRDPEDVPKSLFGTKLVEPMMRMVHLSLSKMAADDVKFLATVLARETGLVFNYV